MKDNIIRTAVCPLCGRTYHGAPALSREDNKTLICGLRHQAGAPVHRRGHCRAGADHRDNPPPYGKPGALKNSQFCCIIK